MHILMFCSVLLLVACCQSATSSSSGLATYILAGLGDSTAASTTARSFTNSTTATPSSALASTDPVTTFPVTAEGGVVLNVTGLVNGDIVAPGTTIFPTQLANSTNTSSSPATTRSPSATGNLTTSRTNSTNACYLSQQSWSNASSAYAANTAKWSTYVTTTLVYDDYFGDYFSRFPNNHTTTLCDSIPRAMGSVEFIPGIRFGSTVTSWTTSGLNYTVPPPTCTISPDQCVSLIDQANADLLPYPDCNITGASTCPDDCTLYAYGGVAQLLYWPEEDVPSLNCSAPLTSFPVAGATVGFDGFTTVQGEKRDVLIANTSVAPKVWSSGDITLTSPTIAMYLQSLSRTDGCGRTLSSYVVTMDPSEASTIRGYNAYYEYYPLHFQDLNTECVEGQGCYAKVSLDAYIGQRTCADDLGVFSRCLTIWNDYNPALVVPPQVAKATSLAPEWGTGCKPINIWGAWDPPKALQVESSVAAASLPGWASTTSTFVPASTSASPASSPQSPATITASAESDTDPIATSSPASAAGVLSSSSSAVTPVNSASDYSSPAADASVALQDPPSSNVQSSSPNVESLLSAIQSVAPEPVSSANAISALQNSATTGEATTQASAASEQALSDASATSTNTLSTPQEPVYTDGTTTQSSMDPEQISLAAAQTNQADPQNTASNSLAGSAAVVTAGSHVITAIPGSDLVIGSTTLSAGGAAATLSNDQVVSLASSGVVVDGTSQAFSAAATASSGSAVVFTAGSQVLTVRPGSSLFIGSTTLSAGGAAATLSDGQVVSLASSGVVVDGTSEAFSAVATQTSASESDLENNDSTLSSGAIVSLGSQAYTAQATSGRVVFGSYTLSPGQVTTISKVAVSDATTGIVVSSETVPFSALPTGAGASSEAVITVGSIVYTAVPASGGSEGIILEDGSTTTTLSIGGSAMTIDGKTVSAGASAVVVASGTQKSTVPLSTAAHPTSINPSGTRYASPSTTTTTGAAAATYGFGLLRNIAFVLLIALMAL